MAGDLRYSVSIDTKGAQQALEGLRGTAAGIAGAIAGSFAAVKVTGIITQFQDLRTSLQILYKDVKLGSAAFEDIKNFAKSSVFSVEELTQTVIKLKAAGIDPTLSRLQLFADVSSVTADRLGALQAITDLYSRTVGGGLGLEELNRLQDRGIDVFGILTKQIGIQRLEVEQYGKTAEGARKILQALEAGLQEQFGGASAQRAGNLSQAISNLGDTVSNTIDLVGRTGLTKALTELTTAFGTLIENNKGLIVFLGSALSEAVSFLARNIGILTAAAATFLSVLAVGTIVRLAQAFALLGGVIAKNPIVRLVAALTGIATAMGIAIGTSDEFAKETERLNKELEKLDQASKQGAIAQGELAKTGDVTRESMLNLNDQLNKFKADMSTTVTEFARFNEQTRQALDLETSLVGVAREIAELRRAEADITRKAADEIAKLQEAKAKLTDEERRQGRGAIIDESIKKIQQQAEVDKKATEEAIKNSEARQRARQLELFSLKTQIDLQEEIYKIQDDIAKSTMSEIEQKYYDIEAAARRSARAAIQAEEARIGRPLNAQEQQAYYDAAVRGVERLKKATEVQYQQSRSFSTGWKKAFNEYVNEATNAAKKAESLFKKATQGMEDLIVNFAKTGKFEWKNFVASMLEELLRSQLQQAFANIMGGIQNSMGGGILDTIGNLLGFGGGGGTPKGQTANNPLYVMDVSSGGSAGGGLFGARPGGNLISGGGIGGGIGQGTSIFSNVIGGISNVVTGIGGAIGNVVDTVSNIGSSIWDAVSGIGDFFGGFFANGGTLGAGKIGVVGERGPELIRGPADISPLSLGGSVTYNINAVDAASFKALVARDPQFIHAVAMQGASYSPSRR